MHCTKLCLALLLVGFFGASARAEDKAPEAKPAAAPEFKLPPGWTAEDLQACMLAGTPGKNHQLLAQTIGEWKGKTTMWMGPGGDPMTSECTSTVAPMMDGRFIKVEMNGEMPGMGPYKGFGIYGFDNVSQKFSSTWIDNHGTAMMTGTGSLADDGKTVTWSYNYNCPITKKPTVMREVETFSADGTKTLEMFGADPKSGQEYKMMRIHMTRK